MLGIFACQHEQQTHVPEKDFDINKTESLLNKNQDSAFYQFNKIATNSQDSSEIAEAYCNMAIIQADAGDYFGSIESALASLKHLDKRNKSDFSLFSSNYNELGLNNINLKNYDNALRYFDMAINYANDDKYKLIFRNNKALAYKGKGNYASAIQIYNDVVPKSKAEGRKEYARALTNLSMTKWLQNPSYNAQPELMEALHIRIRENDRWGQNSSYAHLANYFTESQANLALYYARKRYTMAKALKSPNDQIGALRKLIELGPSDSIKFYFDTYQQLSDSVELSRSAAKNQFALIRYEVEKSKADNLALQKDNAEQAYQINKQRMIIAAIFLAVLALSVVAFFWYKKRKQRLALEARAQIKEHQLKTSKKVHDVVANGIYRVMAEIEHQKQINREGILDRLEVMYEKSRDISYEADGQPANKSQAFNEKITDLLSSFATEITKVFIAGNDNDLWRSISEGALYDVEHILQELMVNMRKHSQATNVAIRFEKESGTAHIYYTDNGIGMSQAFQQGNGLTNTGNRIKNLGGEIIFDTKIERGLKIHISFPV